MLDYLMQYGLFLAEPLPSSPPSRSCSSSSRHSLPAVAEAPAPSDSKSAIWGRAIAR